MDLRHLCFCIYFVLRSVMSLLTTLCSLHEDHSSEGISSLQVHLSACLAIGTPAAVLPAFRACCSACHPKSARAPGDLVVPSKAQLTCRMQRNGG